MVSSHGLGSGSGCTWQTQGVSSTAVETTPSSHGGGAGQLPLEPCGALCRWAVPSWFLARLWGQVGRVPTPVHAVSVGTACSLELFPCPLFEGPTRLPHFASPGGPWPWMVLGAVTSRAGKGIANSRKQACIGCLMMGDPHDGDKQEGDGDAPRFSDSFLDKLSTGVGSILQHP